MIKTSRLKKDKKIKGNIGKDVRNLFRLKQLDNTTIKDVRNIFRLKKEIDVTTNTDIKIIFQTEIRKLNNQKQNNQRYQGTFFSMKKNIISQ